MSVDFSEPRHVLVVHGVQTGTNDDIPDHDVTVADLITTRLNGLPLDFTTSMYRYENVNNEAQQKLMDALHFMRRALIAKVPLVRVIGRGVEVAVDLVGDVFVARRDRTPAAEIRRGLREEIMEAYVRRSPLHLVAHSLGSVYALDVVNELMDDRPDDCFDPERPVTWPVQSLTTLGSPLALPMFSRERSLAILGSTRRWFLWHNYFCRTDPVVAGRLFPGVGRRYRLPVSPAEETYAESESSSRWLVRDRAIDTGRTWLAAHGAYWDQGVIGDDLCEALTR